MGLVLPALHDDVGEETVGPVHQGSRYQPPGDGHSGSGGHGLLDNSLMRHAKLG